MYMRRYKKYAMLALLRLSVLAMLFLLFSGVAGAASLPEGRGPLPGHLTASSQGKALNAWNRASDLANDAPVLTPTSISLVTTPGTNPAPQPVTIQNNSENS